MPPLDSDPHARLRHELRTPLTVIHGSAQLLARMLAGMTSVRPDDRTRLEARLAELDAAAAQLRARIDILTAEPAHALAGDRAARLRATQETLARTRAQIEASRTLLRRVQQQQRPLN